MNNQQYDRVGTIEELRALPLETIKEAQRQGVNVDPDTFAPYLIVDRLRFDIMVTEGALIQANAGDKSE